MARLLRPHIPIPVRIVVAERQLGLMVNGGIAIARMLGAGMPNGYRLRVLIGQLKKHLGENLHLDHDPALAARRKIMRNGEIVGYRPDANDPDHLIYREKAAHQIKTNVRGEHGQHPDRVLIKKTRRLEEWEREIQRKRASVEKSQHPLFRSKKSTWPQGRKLQSRNTFAKRK